MHRRWLWVAAVVVSSEVSAQAALVPRAQELRAATASGNHARAIAIADSLSRVLPHNPSVVLLRAVALGGAGRSDEALDAVRTLLRWDPRFARRALGDTNLVAVRARMGVNVDSLIRLIEQPVSRWEVWATIDERDLVPEGSAWDGRSRSFLIGSMYKHKILAVDPQGRVSVRVAAAANGLRSVIGVHVDSARGLLWATSNSRYDDPTDTTTSALFAFDVVTGAFRRRVPVPAGSGAHFLNDITTTSDGSVYVTDTPRGKVWVARPQSSVLEEFLGGGTLFDPNGITSSTDGSHLFIGDAGGIAVVNLAQGASWRLTTPDSVNTSWIDGLAFARGSLIAHHPLAYWRVVRYRIDPQFRRVTSAEIIERSSPDSRTSTTGEVVGDYYYYLGNTQLDRMNAKTVDAATMDPIRLYRVTLRP